MKIIIEGPPQSGKTTVASVVKERYGLCYVSPGEAVRNAVQFTSSPHSAMLKSLIESDELIPDSLLAKVVSEATRRPDCVNGFVLDGFPRTKKQAQLMREEEGVRADVAVELDISDSVLQTRLSGRWYHPGSGRMYHTLYNPPKQPLKDDITNEPLEQRTEDRPETVLQQTFHYRRQAAELRNLYKVDQWVPVDANGSVETVRNNVFAVLDPIQTAMETNKAKEQAAKLDHANAQLCKSVKTSWWHFW